jgi:hypothetical protein
MLILRSTNDGRLSRFWGRIALAHMNTPEAIILQAITLEITQIS